MEMHRNSRARATGGAWRRPTWGVMKAQLAGCCCCYCCSLTTAVTGARWRYWTRATETRWRPGKEWGESRWCRCVSRLFHGAGWLCS